MMIVLSYGHGTNCEDNLRNGLGVAYEERELTLVQNSSHV